MEAERLRQIEEIYHSAQEMPPDSRDLWLQKACGDDEDLRREVETLLAFENPANNFLVKPPAALAAAMFAEADEQASLVNRQLGRYSIIKLLGKGGMGEVYLAQDTKLDRKVALKILPPEFAANAQRMSRFVREAKTASALNHPNIITIYEIGEAEGAHFIATEFIDGKTLREYARDNPWSYKAALEIAIQVASALEEAHAAGIIHRDIKPDNVMIRGNGLVKILDFGIAKLSDRRGEAQIGAHSGEDRRAAALKLKTTSPGMIIGTADYMSPEQAKGKEVDARTDIFSFGVVLYEMIARKLPFAGETPLEMIGAILKDESQPLPADTPTELQRIISQCLRKNREERYQTIKDVVADLKILRREAEFEHKLERTSAPDKAEPDTLIQPAATFGESKQSTKPHTLAQAGKTRYWAFGLLTLLLTVASFWGYRNFSTSKQIESIAVMPFVNASGNAEIEYLSDGMTETLIGSLSQVPRLNVKARSSVFRYKGQETNAQTIGKQLNVQAILNGRVIQRGDQLILSLELVDTATENVLWSQQYERQQGDIVSLQNDIARDVAGKLKIKLSGAEETKVGKAATTNAEAYQAYLQGRFYWGKRDAENLRKAIQQFKAATDRDPNYALAYAGLADCYAVLNQYAGIPLSETIPRTKAYAERAIALDDQLAEPHATLAIVNNQLWQWPEAEREFQRALELNPNYATAYHWYSILLRDLGRYAESAAMIKRAHELDPLSSMIRINISQVYQAQQNYPASLENTLKVIELDPNNPSAYNNLGLTYLKQRRYAEALASLEKAVALSNRADVVLRNLGYGFGITGKRAEALAIAHKLEEKYARKQSLGQFIATVYAGLGENDKAFAWLEKAFQDKEDLSGIRWNPTYDGLNGDPRFKGLLKRMGLPE